MSSSGEGSYPVNRPPFVLAVDDDRTMLMMLVWYLEKNGVEVEAVGDGQQALNRMMANPERFDAILLDREMPGVHGMEVVARMMAHPLMRRIPIVMQTGSNRPEQIKEGIDAGVFYYLTKPLEEHVLHSVVTAAVRERRQQQNLLHQLTGYQASFQLMERANFRLRTLPEAEEMARFLAQCYPEPERVVAGLAELLVNAVEHGNLQIGYEEKTLLLHENRWREEVLRRAERPEFSSRRVEVVFRRSQEEIRVQITDEGAGFHWKSYLRVDPSRAMDSHGRGIAQANLLSFDRLIYNDLGNQVLAVVNVGAGAERNIAW